MYLILLNICTVSCGSSAMVYFASALLKGTEVESIVGYDMTHSPLYTHASIRTGSTPKMELPCHRIFPFLT